jgi:putative hydrolase of the HAD superfamily
MQSRPLLVLDGDDTLWLVEPLYDQARARTANVVRAEGLDPGAWEALEKKIDVENVTRLGLSAARFPRSCVEAYEVLTRQDGRIPDRYVSDRIAASARSVFDAVAPLALGAQQVLSGLAESNTLVLLTQGESWVQERRIAQSGLAPFFESVNITAEKTADTFRQVLASCSASVANACSVGNSLPSDINPALAIGMSAVWVASDVWEYELRETSALPGRVIAVDRFADVPSAVHRLLLHRHEALA